MLEEIKRSTADENLEENGEEEDLDEADDYSVDGDEFLMELEAAKQIMEEKGQTKKTDISKVNTTDKEGLTLALNKLENNLPWAEVLAVKSVPFQFNDVHDDLSREISFYNCSLEAVKIARQKLLELNIPYKRPADYLCEMVKTDSHMDRVKDKLIFEEKKMEAFQQRKERIEQRKFSKQLNARKQREKAVKKKESIKNINQWRKESNAKVRNGPMPDKDRFEEYLSKHENALRPALKGHKRVMKDLKYGRGVTSGGSTKSKGNIKFDKKPFKRGGSGSLLKKGLKNKGGTRLGKSKRAALRNKRKG